VQKITNPKIELPPLGPSISVNGTKES